jgi:hypothetical protein
MNHVGSSGTLARLHWALTGACGDGCVVVLLNALNGMQAFGDFLHLQDFILGCASVARMLLRLELVDVAVRRKVRQRINSRSK